VRLFDAGRLLPGRSGVAVCGTAYQTGAGASSAKGAEPGAGAKNVTVCGGGGFQLKSMCAIVDETNHLFLGSRAFPNLLFGPTRSSIKRATLPALGSKYDWKVCERVPPSPNVSVMERGITPSFSLKYFSRWSRNSFSKSVTCSLIRSSISPNLSSTTLVSRV